MTNEQRRKKKDKEAWADEQRKRKIFKDDEEAKKRYLQYCSKDPFPDIASALLNSADIYNYVEKTGMIFPFYPEDLVGATYGVAIGEKVVWWDEQKEEICEKDLTKQGSYFELKPNSIAFVMLEPTFRIPDYIALRFNLKIMHIYRGLLLGTGPIVDPGFVGKLSIPLHNLTANTYTFRHGDKLIAMEFTKLSPNEAWENNAGELVSDKLYKRTWIKEGRTVYDYLNRALERSSDVMVKSSIPVNLKKVRDISEKAQKDVEDAKKELDQRFRSVQWITILSLVPVLAFAVTAIYQLGTANTVKKEAITELKGECQHLQEQYEGLQEQYKQLNTRLEELGIDLNEAEGLENENKD